MNTYKDYHIEIMSLKLFADSLFQSKKLTKEDGILLFNCMKQVILNGEFKPFASHPPKGETDSYYDKYVRLESEMTSYFIPGFFLFGKNFYEIERHCNVYIERTNYKTFETFFLLKLIEITSTGLSVPEFLNFQLFDNFGGNKNRFAGFLYYLPKNDGNFRQSPKTRTAIRNWIKENSTTDEVDLGNSFFNESAFETDDLAGNDLENSPNQDSLKDTIDFKIDGNFTDDEIRKFWSFLYLEKSCEMKPFLQEKHVIDIFKNGLLIPAQIPAKKYSLNCDRRFPKKIIDYAIYLFYTRHSKKVNCKAYYLKFFGSYLQEYQGALESKSALKNVASNISGERSLKDWILWNNYLPARFAI